MPESMRPWGPDVVPSGRERDLRYGQSAREVPVRFGDGPILPADVETSDLDQPDLKLLEEHGIPDRTRLLPMKVEVGSFNGYPETIELRRSARLDVLNLRVDTWGGRLTLKVEEPNVRELRDMLNRWLGE